MLHELKTAQELLEIVSNALDANADTAGWSPTGIQEHAEGRCQVGGQASVE